MIGKSLLMILLFSVAFLLMSCAVSAAMQAVGPMCFPSGHSVCAGFGMDCVCSDAMYDNGAYYCSVDDVRQCSGTCNQATHQCEGEVSQCLQGHQRCCLDAADCMGNTPRNEGDAYSCGGGRWLLMQTCSVGQTCQETSSTLAGCHTTKWYYSGDGYSCIWIEAAEQPTADYYPTLQECQANLGKTQGSSGGLDLGPGWLLLLGIVAVVLLSDKK